MKKILTAAITAAVAANPFSPEVAAQTDGTATEIYVSVYHANSWVEHNLEEVGIYRFQADRYAPELIMQDPYLDASGGGAMTDDFYFCTAELNYGSWTEITHYGFDPETWTERMRLTDGSPKAVAMDLAYDPQTAKLFGCFNNDNGDGYVFGTLNIATGERFSIADLDTPWLACSVDRNGELYAIDMDGVLLKVDKVYGTVSPLADLGVKGSIRSTGAIDPRTNLFYFVVSSQEAQADPEVGYRRSFSDLYSVDLTATDLTATHRYEFSDGEVMGGMWIPGPVAAADAPAAPENLEVTFADGSLEGTIEFTIPARTFGGDGLDGEISYLARANGALLAQGKAMAGTKVNAPARVAEAAMYDIEVTLSNAGGRSPKAKLTRWIGHDTPKAITEVTLTYADGKFVLTWNAPEESEHGGYYDPSLISYSVKRNPDGATWEGVTEPRMEDAVEMTPQLTVYSYDVTMSYDGRAIQTVSSNVWRLGAMTLPWTTDFSAENALELFTVIDVNGDRAEWYREWEWWIDETEELVSAAVYPYSSTKSADDWLITPPMQFEAGNSYTLSFEAMVMSSSDPERLKVSMGQTPSAEAMTITLLEPFELTSMTPQTYTAKISPEATGVYYIGFHACSDPFRSGLALKTIAVSAAESGTEAIEAVNSGVEVKANEGTIAITANHTVAYSVVTADGRVCASGTVDGTKEIALPAGIYIVIAGESASKVAVR